MSSPSIAIRDLRALGSSAPMRAIYETSKRTGFHRVLFRGPSEQSRHQSVPLALGTCVPPSGAARRRCVEDAEAILSQGLRVFGRRVKTGVFAPWSEDPLTGEAWPTGVPWWEIDIRSESRLSDVKFVWEAGRHRDLVVLARAALLEPDGPWLEGLNELLARWCAQQPPERGINWYSSLELALRAIAWSQILALVGDRLPQQLRSSMNAQLIASAWHITIELPYTVSSMKNNHMLGDGLGLVVLGRMFPTHPWARRWKRLGDGLFDKQLGRHMRQDGSMIEDSLSYHRFVLEMLAVRILIGGAGEATRLAVRGAARHLEALGVFHSSVPQYGDWDEGRVLADSVPAESTAGSAWLGLALSGRHVPEEAWTQHDELAWYLPQSASARHPRPRIQRGQISASGGISRVHSNGWTVWFKSGGGRSHQHADLLSVWVMKDGQWIVRDPGTGTYNGPLSVRNGFRASSAHPVWRPAGQDQLRPHRAFRWMHHANCFAATPVKVGEQTVLFGWHDAFERLQPGTKVARAVIVAVNYVAVVEGASGYAGEWELTVPLGPEPVNADTNIFGLEGAHELCGEPSPFRGWHSATYGEWKPSPWLQAVSAPPDFPVWGCGKKPATVEGQSPSVDGTSFAYEWEEDAVTLVVASAHQPVRRLRVERD